MIVSQLAHGAGPRCRQQTPVLRPAPGASMSRLPAASSLAALSTACSVGRRAEQHGTFSQHGPRSTTPLMRGVACGAGDGSGSSQAQQPKWPHVQRPDSNKQNAPPPSPRTEVSNSLPIPVCSCRAELGLLSADNLWFKRVGSSPSDQELTDGSRTHHHLHPAWS